MASINSRLDQVENSLTPKQTVIAWLERAQKFESLEGYCGWILQQPGEHVPIRVLARQIEASIRGRTKGEDPENIQTAVRQAQREGISLFCLCLKANQDFASHSRPIALMAMLSVECVGSAIRETKNPTDLGRWGNYQNYFRMYATEVFNLKASIEYLEKKYFDGHPMLWKSQAGELNLHVAQIDQIALLWNDVFVLLNLEESRSRGRGARKSDSPGELDLDLEALKKLVDPIAWTRNLIHHARADALAMIGDTDAAISVLKSSFRAES